MFKMHFPLRSQRGALLLYQLVLVILPAVLIPVLYTLLSHSYNRQSARTSQERYVHMLLSLKRQLEDALICSRLMQGKVVPLTQNGEQDITLNWSYAGTNGPFGIGWESKDKLIKVKRLYLRTTGQQFHQPRLVRTPGASSETLTSIPLRVYLQVEQTALNLKDSETASPELPETVPPGIRPDLTISLHANLNSTGQIVTCYGAHSAAATCQAIGGTYNPDGPPELRCQPDQLCFSGHTGLVANAADCPSQPVQYRSIPVGKNSAGVLNYMCVLCHEDL